MGIPGAVQYRCGRQPLWKSCRCDCRSYRKDTKDMLVPQSVPVTSGYSDIYVPYINAGQIRNQGIETVITSYNYNRDNFKWTTDVVFAYNDNEVIDINSDTPLTTGSIGLNYTLSRIQPGYPINVFYGFVQDGIFQSQAEVDNAAVQVPGENPATSTAAGDIRYKDLNNDGVINDDDRTFIGNPNPDFTYSLNNTFTYKNFDLNIFIQGVHGNDIFNATRLNTENMSVTTNQSTAVLAPLDRTRHQQQHAAGHFWRSKQQRETFNTLY